jgi:deazaflavin-dependent oxidoreductase (nitroreductase family)
MSDLNDSVIAEFRANGGVVTEAMGGHFKDSTVALLHHVGRRSGRTYVQPVLCTAYGDTYVLAGSNGGAPAEPFWVANLEAMSETTLELGTRIFRVKATVLRDGEVRDRLYAAFAAFWPDVLEYEKNTDRSFPVIQLEPIS